MVTTWDKLFSIAENLEWHITYDMPDNGALYQMDFSKYSPAGEDFSFYCEADSPDEMAREVYDTYDGFNTDEHAIGCYGMRGAPDLHALIHDAEAIKEMIFELYDALREA